MVSLLVYLAVIAFGVGVTIWGLKNGKLLAIVAGAAVAILTTLNAGVI